MDGNSRYIVENILKSQTSSVNCLNIKKLGYCFHTKLKI